MPNELAYTSAIIKPLLEFPDELTLDSQHDERGVLVLITVSPKDMGHVIGKNGDTARAIRRLVRQWGAGAHMHVSLKINEPTPLP